MATYSDDWAAMQNKTTEPHLEVDCTKHSSVGRSLPFCDGAHRHAARDLSI